MGVCTLTVRSVETGPHGGHGLLLQHGELRLGLDVGLPGVTTLLSHAHADHIGSLSGAREVVMTRQTLEVLRARNGTVRQPVRTVEFGKQYEFGNATVTPLNAGHVLGSTMFLIELGDGTRVLYTGDFNTEDSLVHTAAEPVEADVLITEATYGSPEWVFPDRPKVYDAIVTSARRDIEDGLVPVFRAYSLGKAQEATALLSQNGTVVASGNFVIDRVNWVYARYSQSLSWVDVADREALREALSAGCAIVASDTRHLWANLQRHLGHTTTRAIVGRAKEYRLSGWSLHDGSVPHGLQARPHEYPPRWFRHAQPSGFPLSAHADFHDLIGFASAVAPRIAYCFVGPVHEFAGHLAGRGIDAVPVG